MNAITKAQATAALLEDGLDWSSPMIEIVDTLAELADNLGMRRPHEVADRAANRWAEPPRSTQQPTTNKDQQ